MDKDDLIKLLLEEYSISEVFERMDLTEEEVLEHLINSGRISCQRLIDEIPLPAI